MRAPSTLAGSYCWNIPGVAESSQQTTVLRDVRLRELRMVELFVQRLEVIEYPPGGSSSVEHQYLDPAWSHIEQAILRFGQASFSVSQSLRHP